MQVSFFVFMYCLLSQFFFGPSLETRIIHRKAAVPKCLTVVLCTIVTIMGYRELKFVSVEEALDIVSIFKDGSRRELYLILNKR